MAGRRLLMVEGSDDEHVLRSICAMRGLPVPEIRQLGGVGGVLPAIPQQLQLSTGEDDDIVGIIVDADINREARWQAVCDRLNQAGYEGLPTAPDTNGTIIPSPDDSLLPRTGVWIWPDNGKPGILEDFLRGLVPAGDGLMPIAARAVNSLEEKRFSVNDQPKAVMHTWLAWQSDPGRPYGTAITAGFLDSNLPQADALVSWIQTLFDSPEDSL